MVCFIPSYSISDDKNIKIALEMSFSILEMSFAIFFGNEFRSNQAKNACIKSLNG